MRRLAKRPVAVAAAVACAAVVCAVGIMLPAPFPGHVVSSNDVLRQATPWATQGGPVDAVRLRNTLLADPAEVFRPDLYWARTQVRGGHIPMWDPLLFSGWPLLASQQTAPFYPVRLLSYVMPYEASVGAEIALLLALTALGGYLFARELRMRAAPAGLGGLAYALSAPMLVWSMHPQSNVHATLPWMMLGAERALGRRRWGLATLAAAVGVAALGGHPESVLLDGLLVLAWVVFRLAPRAPWRARAASAGRVAGAGTIGLAAGAVMLLPLLELLRQSPVGERGGFAGPGLKSLFTLAVPDVWGRPDWIYQLNPLGLENYAERTAYLGAAPVLLVVVGLLVRRDAVRWFFAAAGVAAVVLAMHVPGISPWLARQWPLRLVNVGREVSVLAFCLAMLAGLGLDAILDRPAVLRRPAVIAGGLVVFLVPLVWIVAEFHPRVGLSGAFGFLPGAAKPATAPEAAAAAGLRWALFGGAALALLLALALRIPRVPAWALVLVLALDLTLGWHGYVPVTTTSQSQLPTTKSIEVLRDNVGQGRSAAGAALSAGQPMFPNAGEYFGVRDARGRGVPTVGRTLKAWTELGAAGGPGYAVLDPADPSDRALRAFGVTDVLTFRGAPQPPGSRLLYSGVDGAVYGIDGTTPRAFVTCRWTPTAYAAATRRLRRATVDSLEQSPLVETGAAPGTCRRPARAARIVTDQPDTVTIDVSGLGPGRLVLLDTYYPGWSARVDGANTGIQAANVAFRSVALPAGARRVTFTYGPASVHAGVAISGVAWLLIAGAFVVPAVARRRRRPTGTAAARGPSASSAG